MAGIYIHIPFCKQACFYCNFHFSTQLNYKEKVVGAIAKELFLRKDFLEGQKIETIYFGGGTPSLLTENEFSLLLETIQNHFDLSKLREFTVEANPDDIQLPFLNILKKHQVNRLSIGIQSFDDNHLKLMNRAHNAEEAKVCVQKALDMGFENLSVDLIYGIPGMSKDLWQENLNKAINLGVNHISSYCLTIEPKTVFGKYQKLKKLAFPEDDITAVQFEKMIEVLTDKGFEHYEISNFARNKAYSMHNTNYWNGISYLGVGPGAHSYFPGKRMWNVNNNHKYVQAIEIGNLPLEIETLGLNDQYNEYIMTGLRTQWGIDLNHIEKVFGNLYLQNVITNMQKHILSGHILQDNNRLLLSRSGKFLADGIASDAFIID